MGVAHGKPWIYCRTQMGALCRRRQWNKRWHGSDQVQISPVASPVILHHTVWRTWLFIAYTQIERWFLYQFSLPHLYISLEKVGRMYFLKSGVKGLKRSHSLETPPFPSLKSCPTKEHDPLQMHTSLQHSFQRMKTKAFCGFVARTTKRDTSRASHSDQLCMTWFQINKVHRIKTNFTVRAVRPGSNADLHMSRTKCKFSLNPLAPPKSFLLVFNLVRPDKFGVWPNQANLINLGRPKLSLSYGVWP